MCNKRERCTKLFFSLEENRQKADTINEVLKQDGSKRELKRYWKV